MFLLVSVRHVGAHPDELQHGVSIQSSINLGKTFPRISRIRIIPSTQILARVFVYLPPFISQILDFIYWTVLIFILIYFEWRGTENHQLRDFRFYHLRVGRALLLQIQNGVSQLSHHASMKSVRVFAGQIFDRIGWKCHHVFGAQILNGLAFKFLYG